MLSDVPSGVMDPVCWICRTESGGSGVLDPVDLMCWLMATGWCVVAVQMLCILGPI